jgi:hypothetical protein
MIEFRIIQLDTGGFIVKNGFFDNVFASTRIDEALVYVRDNMTVDPLKARNDMSRGPNPASETHIS